MSTVALAAVFGWGINAAAQTRHVKTQINVNSVSCAGCDFSDKAMTRSVIRDTNLSGSLFNRTNLSGSQIVNSNFTGAHLKKAFLARVAGENVNFSGAKLEDATLREAKFDVCELSGADLRRSDLSSVSITKSNLKAADLSSTEAVGAIFSGSNFDNARFNQSSLLGARLSDGSYRQADFGNALLKGAELDGADFSGANLSSVRGLTQAQLDTACGDLMTQLPRGLSIRYCENSETQLEAMIETHDHARLLQREKQRLESLEESMKILEAVMPTLPAAQRYEVEKAHRKIATVQRELEN